MTATDDERNQVALLLDVTQKLSASLDKGAVYQAAAQAFMATGADGCTLALVNSSQVEQPAWFEVVAVVDRQNPDAAQDFVGQRFAPADYPSLQRLLEERQPIVVPDVSADQTLNEAERQFLRKTGTRALVVLPLIGGEAVIGYIYARRRQPYAFSPQELSLHRALANQVTIAAEHARQIEEARRRTTQLTTAAEVSRLVSSILDPKELIDRVVSIVRERFDFYYVGLFLTEQIGEHKYAVLKAGTGEAGRAQLEASHRLLVGGESMVGWCIANGAARITADVDLDAVRFANPYLPATRSEIALPLNSRGGIIGALTVQSTQLAAFRDDDISVLQTVADQVATAIENARLFSTVNLALEETNTLYTLSRRIIAAQTVEEAAGIVIEAVPKDPFDHVILVLKDDPGDPDNLWTEVIAGWDRTVPAQKFVGNRYSSEMIPLLANPNVYDVIIEPDVEHGDILDEASRRAFTGLGVKSLIAVPLFAGERLLGWLVAEAIQQPRSFNANDVRTLQLLADQAGISIDRLQATSSLLKSQAALERRAVQLKSAAEVSRIATSILDVESLTRQVVELIGDRFDFYYVGLFLVDQSGQWAILKAATGDEGRRQVAEGRRLAIDESTGIGRCISTGQVQQPDPADAADGSSAPHSEIILPLRSRGEIRGALTVQSVHEAAIGPEEIEALQLMADQLANALQNSQLFEATQRLARREQLINEITAKIRSTTDPDKILQVSVQELGRILGASRASIRVDPEALIVE